MGLVGDKLDSHVLRDFLRIRDDGRQINFNRSTSSSGGPTLYAMLSEMRSPAPPHPAAADRSPRTLLDVIREDRATGVGGGRGSWRQLRDKIRLRSRDGGGGSAWSSAASTRFDSAESTHPDPSLGREETRRRIEAEDDGSAEQPARMSLMALLAENDRQMGVEGSPYAEKDDVVADEEGSGSGAAVSCCVCMVRHKDAAFIPCGHTFCRRCSREIWAQRRNCPLCNTYISEILDIF